MTTISYIYNVHHIYNVRVHVFHTQDTCQDSETKHACENGNKDSAAVEQFSRELGHPVSESTVKKIHSSNKIIFGLSIVLKIFYVDVILAELAISLNIMDVIFSGFTVF